MNYTKIAAFLALSLGLVWLSIFIANLFILGPIGGFALGIFHLWTPGIAAFIVQKWIFQESMADYGFSRKSFGASWVLASIFLPYVLVVAVLATVFVFGNLFQLPGFGFVVLGQIDPNASFELAGLLATYLPIDPIAMMPQELWIFVIIILVAGFFFGPTLGLITSFGEELGWRGLMLEETKQLGFFRSNLVIGSLWALWLLPQFLRTPEVSSGELYLGVLAFIGYSISFSFPLAYLSRKSKTIFGPAIFRGVFNIVGLVTIVFIWGENPMVGSATGVAGMIVFLLVTLAIVRRDPEFVEQYAKLNYAKEDEE